MSVEKVDSIWQLIHSHLLYADIVDKYSVFKGA